MRLRIFVWLGVTLLTAGVAAGLAYSERLVQMLTDSEETVPLLTPVVAIQQHSCATIVDDPSPPLKVRSTPAVSSTNVVGKLKNGTRVYVVAELNGWLKINAPMEGWVSEGLIRTNCISASNQILEQ